LWFPRHDVVFPTPRFIHFTRADQDDWIAVMRRLPVDQPLGAARRRAAHHADSLQLVHGLGKRQQARHRSEWLAAEIHVQAGGDHPDAAIRKLLDNLWEPVVKKIGLKID